VARGGEGSGSGWREELVVETESWREKLVKRAARRPAKIRRWDERASRDGDGETRECACGSRAMYGASRQITGPSSTLLCHSLHSGPFGRDSTPAVAALWLHW
jgi:hypothetical protein